MPVSSLTFAPLLSSKTSYPQHPHIPIKHGLSISTHNLRKTYFVCRIPPSKSLSANATASNHASTLHTKLKTFMMPQLFVLKLKNFQYSFINNFLIITKTSRVPYCQQSALLLAECLTVSRVPSVFLHQ